MPKTKLGRWAGGLAAVFLVLFVVLISIRNINGAAAGSPSLVGVGTFAMLAGVGAFITGFISLFKNRDRTLIVYMASVLGLMASLFAFGVVVRGIIRLL